MSSVHDEVAELLGAYALHAIDDLERILVERHVVECDDCRRELSGFAEVTAALGATDPAGPSSSWPAIAAQLNPSPPRLNPSPPRAPAPRRWFAIAASVSLAALALVAVMQRGQINRLDAEIARVQVQEANFVALDEQTLLQQAASVALAEPEGRLLSLGAEDTARQVTIVLSSDGSGYIADHNLPPLPDNRTYQLWAVVGDQVVSVGVLGRSPNVVAFHLDSDHLAGFAVTEEVRGGVVASENPAVVAWFASAEQS